MKIYVLAIYLSLISVTKVYALDVYYTIQISSFKNLIRAKNLYQKINKEYKYKNKFLRLEKIKNIYAVRIGKFKNKKKCKNLLKIVRSDFHEALLFTAYVIDKRIILPENFNIKYKNIINNDLSKTPHNYSDFDYLSSKLVNDKAYNSTIIPKYFVDNINLQKNIYSINLKDNIDKSLSLYKNSPKFRGFYFKTDMYKQLKNGEMNSDYRLEWSLFKDGWHEIEKKFKKIYYQNELQYLQVLNDASQHWLSHKLDEAELLNRTIYYHRACDFLSALNSQVERRKVQLIEGYIIQEDFDHINLQLQQFKMEKDIYSDHKHIYIAPSILKIINNIEFLNLKNIISIQDTAINNSYSLKTQKNLINRSELINKWSDNVSLDLYLEKEYKSNYTTSNDNIGLEIEIPLYWNNKQEKYIKSKKLIYEEQYKILETRIKENIENLYNFLKFQKLLIKKMKYELYILYKNIYNEKERLKYIIENLDYTPERSLDLLKTEKIRMKYEVILARVKAYEILIKLVALSHVDNIEKLIAEN